MSKLIQENTRSSRILRLINKNDVAEHNERNGELRINYLSERC